MSGIKKITDEVKAAVTKSVEPMKNLTTQAKSMANQSASSVSQMKSQMKSYTSSISETAKQQDYLKSKIEDLKNLLSQADMGMEVGDTLKIEADIEKLENRLRKLQSQGQNTSVQTSSAFDKIKAKVKTTGSHIVGLGSKFKNVLSHSKTLSKSFTTTFNNGINSIKKFALGLLSVRTAFSMVSKAMQSYLSYDTQLSNSIQNCWNALGSLLAPILEFVISLFSKAVSYVNAFVQALTGINLVARANKKAIDSQAKSTKKLSEAQSSLDEFHTVNKDSGTGGSANKPITVEPVDLSKLDFLFDWIKKVKKLLATLFDPIKKAWDKKGKIVINSFKNALLGIGNLGKSVFSSMMKVWTNGTGQKTVELYLDILSQILDIIGSIANKWAKAWNNNGNGTQIIQSLWNGINNLLFIVDSFFLSFKQKWEELGQPICDIFISVILSLSKHFENLTQKFKDIWNNGGKFLFEKILELGAKIIEVAGLIYEQFVSPFIDWFINKIVPALSPLLQAFGNIISVATNVLDFIKNVFTGDWTKAWQNIKNIVSNIWNGIKNMFSFGGQIFVGITTGLKNVFVSIINQLIKGVNRVLKIPFDGFNDVLKKIKNFEILDQKPFKGLISTIAVPQIPSLASGGVLDSETIVRVAEYSNAKSNPEIISPKDMMKETFKEAIEESGMKNSQTQKLDVEVHGKTEVDGDKLVVVYDKAKNNKGYDGGKNPSFAY